MKLKLIIMTAMQTISTSKILNSYKANSGVKMRNLTSKFNDVISDVKYYVSEGWNRNQAIDFSIEEFSFMFDNNEEKDLLKNWLLKNISK